MVTLGFTFSYSDLVTVGTNFPFASSYIYVQTGGDLVYQAPDGTFQWVQGVQSSMLLPIAALRVVASGTVNGVSRTTTASGMVYMCAPKY